MATEMMNSNVIKLNAVRDFLKANVNLQLKAKWAPRMYIQGAPGCGKSYILRDICVENGWALKTFFISNSALEMLTGLPCKVSEGEGAAWTRPEILDMSVKKLEYVPENYVQGKTPTILLLDDFHLCDRMMQKYCFQLFTEMGLNGYKLPENTAIIIAGNRAQDKAGAMPIPAPVCNRMMFIEVESEADDWIMNFAIKHNVRGDIVTFIKNKGDVFLSQQPIESTAWASPRAWTYLSSQMDAYEESCKHIDMHTLIIMATGLVGPEYAKEFVAYRELFAKWDFDKLMKANWNSVKDEFQKSCEKNPTSVYAILTAGVTWCVNVYKKAKYNDQDKNVIESMQFVYKTMCFLLGMKCKNINTRPLIAAGLSYVEMLQKAQEKSDNTRNVTPLIRMLLSCMTAKRDCDWMFYDLVAEIFKIKLDAEDIENINRVKDLAANGKLKVD